MNQGGKMKKIDWNFWILTLIVFFNLIGFIHFINLKIHEIVEIKYLKTGHIDDFNQLLALAIIIVTGLIGIFGPHYYYKNRFKLHKGEVTPSEHILASYMSALLFSFFLFLFASRVFEVN